MLQAHRIMVAILIVLMIANFAAGHIAFGFFMLAAASGAALFASQNRSRGGRKS